MAAKSSALSFTLYTSPPSSPRASSVPIAGKNAQSMDTHRLIKEKAEEIAQAKASSLEGRVSTSTTPEKKSPEKKIKGWADLNSSSGSFTSSGSETGVEDQEATMPLSRSSFVTPLSSPVKTKDFTTPEAVQALKEVIKNQDFSFDLTPDSEKTMTRAIDKLNDLDSPYRSQQKSQVRGTFCEALEKTGSTSEVSSPLAPRRLFSTVERDDLKGDWTATLAKTLDVSFLDTMHLKDLEEAGGFHVCPEGHPRDAYVKHRRINLATGVWCGKVFDLKDSKTVVKPFSSFVPRQMTLERFKILIAEAQGDDEREIARQNNRRLYEVIDGENRFMIECYRQLDETLIRSAIPIFHYEVYQGTESSFDVDYSFQLTLEGDAPLKQMTYKVVYKRLFEQLKTKPEAIVYKTEEKIIVDVGLLFGDNCPIDQGLWVEIPKKFLI